jgi:hypothetical protein
MSNLLQTNWDTGFKGRYRPACGGKEVPFLRDGRWYLVVWDTKKQERLLYCYDTDSYEDDE